MTFIDRRDAGKKLSKLLSQYAHSTETIIIGLPRGGVIVADELKKALSLPLDIVCPRKIGAPFNPELAIGAVTETGEAFYNQSLISQLGVSKEFVQKETEKARLQALHYYELFRKNKPPLDIKNKTVIICDDGLATGATLQAAIKAIKAKNPGKVIVAVPVAPLEGLNKFRKIVDEVVCIEAQEIFFSVGEFYEDFAQTDDQEVIECLKPNL